jgi:hypothetical protein
MDFWSARSPPETPLRSDGRLPSGAGSYGRRKRKRHGRYKRIAAVEVNA